MHLRFDPCEEPPRNKAPGTRRRVVRLKARQELPGRHQRRPTTLKLNLTEQTGDLTQTQTQGKMLNLFYFYIKGRFLTFWSRVLCNMDSRFLDVWLYLHGVDGGALGSWLDHELQVVVWKRGVQTTGHTHLQIDRHLSLKLKPKLQTWKHKIWCLMLLELSFNIPFHQLSLIH